MDMAAWLFENGADPAALCQRHSAYAFAAVFSYADLVARPDALGQTTPLTDMEQMLAQAAKGCVNRPQFAGGSKVSMDGAYGKK